MAAYPYMTQTLSNLWDTYEAAKTALAAGDATHEANLRTNRVYNMNTYPQTTRPALVATLNAAQSAYYAQRNTEQPSNVTLPV